MSYLLMERKGKPMPVTKTITIRTNAERQRDYRDRQREIAKFNKLKKLTTALQNIERDIKEIKNGIKSILD